MADIRLADVAREAKVSLATASRVVNGSDRVPGEEVTRRVLEAAKRLGYVPNAAAQALARSVTRLVGILVHDIADPFFSSIVSQLEAELAPHGDHVILAQTRWSKEAEERAIRAFLSQRVDALVFVGSGYAANDIDSAAHTSVGRFVERGGIVVGAGAPNLWGRSVRADDTAAAATLLTALVASGISRFVLHTPPETITSAALRLQGFRTTLAGHGITPIAELPGVLTWDAGAHLAGAVVSLIDDGVAPCVVMCSDVAALGLVAELLKKGVRVPHDVQVTGYDGIALARDFSPSITTVDIGLAAIGAGVAHTIVRATAGEAEDEGDTIISHTLVQGSSTIGNLSV